MSFIAQGQVKSFPRLPLAGTYAIRGMISCNHHRRPPASFGEERRYVLCLRGDVNPQLRDTAEGGVVGIAGYRLVRSHNEEIKVFARVSSPFAEILLNERDRRYEEERSSTL